MEQNRLWERKGVQEVIVGAEGKKDVNAFDESPLKDRPLPAEKWNQNQECDQAVTHQNPLHCHLSLKASRERERDGFSLFWVFFFLGLEEEREREAGIESFGHAVILVFVFCVAVGTRKILTWLMVPSLYVLFFFSIFLW